jgi:hypothetical protein
MHATHGLPLEVLLPLLADRGVFPTWDALFRAALADGANLERLHRQIDQAIGDAWAPATAQVIRARLALLVTRYQATAPAEQASPVPKPSWRCGHCRLPDPEHSEGCPNVGWEDMDPLEGVPACPET